MPERLVRLKVHPGSSSDRLERRGPDHYEAWVRAPALQGRANEAVLRLLRRDEAFAGKRLRLIKGALSPSKIVSVL
ncbi:MAG: DUF167 domain-containing protein [Elusimicrobia bacterium]|nr:DUF167 domain-containing protein [Elusimicrobiota bacterium]